VRIVVALGGNALLRRGEPAEAETQRRNLSPVSGTLASLSAQHELVVTHGNGPQVGLLALEANAYKAVHAYPLDILGAESQGMIGYLLVQALSGELRHGSVVALLTRVVVDSDDPAFARPTKPIGPVYSEPEALELAEQNGWTVAPDGPFFRRVVGSPEPRRIVELASIIELLEAGSIVVCAGGGGVPVVADGSRLVGVEAVVDKDLTAALLAADIGADRLLMLTDVPNVERGWGSYASSPIRDVEPAELRALSFAPGSMGPKVEAACRFVERTGRTAAIGALDQLEQVVSGIAGTQISPAVREFADGLHTVGAARAGS